MVIHRAFEEARLSRTGSAEAVDGGDLWIRLHSESWRARADAGTLVAVGDEVRVRSVDGLLLHVEPVGAAGSTAERSP